MAEFGGNCSLAKKKNITALYEGKSNAYTKFRLNPCLWVTWPD